MFIEKNTRKNVLKIKTNKKFELKLASKIPWALAFSYTSKRWLSTQSIRN